MAVDPDDEALSWSGQTDPTHVAEQKKAKDAATSGGGSSAARDAKLAKRAGSSPQDQQQKARLSAVVLLMYGVLAGIYLLYVIGWGAFGLLGKVPAQGLFFSIMYQVGLALAMASPLLWAIAVWLRVKSAPWRLLWLLFGALILVPWPVLFVGLR